MFTNFQLTLMKRSNLIISEGDYVHSSKYLPANQRYLMCNGGLCGFNIKLNFKKKFGKYVKAAGL